MRICVTGGAGYVGSALVPLLDDCHVVDDFSVGVLENLPNGFEDCQFSPFHMGEYEDVDAVVHLAAAVGEARCDESPGEAIRRNISKLDELLRKLAKLRNPPHFVFASSLVVYGDGDSPFHEDQPHKPLNIYAATKCMGEHLVRLSGLPHTILRFANIYGLGKICRPDSLTGKFARCVAKGESLPIWGDGSQRVDMIHVRDVAKACKHFAESRIEGTFNIGSGTSASVNQLARNFIEAGHTVGYCPAPLVPAITHPRPDYEIPHDRCVSVDKATVVGWHATEQIVPAAEELIRHASDQA